MGTLAAYLQHSFSDHCPPGWTCQQEVRVLSPELERTLGYAPRADIVLERDDGQRRLWVEFEVSRADPVANHAKFATAHLFHPQSPSDTFVSMVSSHVATGRRNLAANTIMLMRHIGMDAFQTVLLPGASPGRIAKWNQLSIPHLHEERIAVGPEVLRVLAVSDAVLTAPGRRIHFVGDMMEVMLNLRRWNQDLATSEGQDLWGRRTVTYFVFDPRSGHFAPSKFCAYSAIFGNHAPDRALTAPHTTSEMTVALYVTLDGIDSRFDGRRAWKHLSANLAFEMSTPDKAVDILPLFESWLARHAAEITLHPGGPIFLCPPPWFQK